MTPWDPALPVVKVMLIEDHDEFRRSLEFFLAATGHVDCTAYPDAEQGLQALGKDQPDVVIMDINLPGMDGIACTARMRERAPHTQVLVCTVHEDDERLFEALRAGAAGYLLKRSSIEELLEAIRQVLAGGSPMSPAIARKVVNSFRPQLPQGPDQLSEREQEVLQLLSTGHTAKEIAEKLFVSVNTVRSHIRHIYEKLHVQSRVEMLNKLRNGGHSA